ncbi:hypothetical protein NHH03_12880 [Stieleria sp. TO1_6]|uniref:hypothetical protein n=1 Tax=Stieleria tagensis TaxID=2956795 RepID=UPI00209B696E|nr:hypothetical protein [Stieleria tagensis]MCO8122634.1 hypothetical protein [Stieleria tagensis]
MESDLNPYQPIPTAAARPLESGELSFAGQISETDYIALLPQQRLLRGLVMILLVLLAPVTLMTAGVCVYMVATLQSGHETVIAFAMLLFLLTLSYVAIRILGPGYRARRQLKRHPDLLGPAQGRFASDGLVFDDGDCTHWFAANWHLGILVHNSGIRVPIDTNPYRYLALSERLFDHFDAPAARRQIEAWKTQADTTNGWSQWPLTGDDASDQVRFAGSISTRQSLQTADLKSKAVMETLAVAAGVAGTALAWHSDHTEIMILCAAYTLFTIVSSIRIWRMYFVGHHDITWDQSGWISDTELAWRTEFQGAKIPLREFERTEISEQALVMTSRRGVTFLILREHVESDDQWQRISQQFATERLP